MSKQSPVLIISAALIFSSCTASPDTEVVADPVSEQQVVEKIVLQDVNTILATKNMVDAECPPSDTVCPMNFAPVMCAALAGEGKKTEASDRLVVWATNNCAGRLKLHRESCARKFPPSKLKKLQCFPDATGGHCPIAAGECKPGGKPASCIAATYAGHGLSDDLKLTADAANECLARLELQMVACRENLDPTQLGDISCRYGKAVK
ncbi:MAG: hypothetical protein FJ146_03840 [Deltaproteobacteria bacterium]|nr:hypothetical protein [Deltaproteobacteria bacterium]